MEKTINATFAIKISGANVTTNYTTFGVGDPTASTDNNNGLIKLPFTEIPSGAVITAATLQIYNNSNDASNARTTGVYRCRRAMTNAATYNTWNGTDLWTTAGATNTTDDIEATDIGSISLVAAQAVGYFSITLTASKVQEMFTGVFTNNGFALESSPLNTYADDRHEFQTTNDANPPRWVITYQVGGGAFFGLM